MMSLRRIDSELSGYTITILSILKSISTLHPKEELDKLIPFDTDWDTVHYVYYNAIELCADRILGKYYEDYGNEVIGLERDEMTDYYRLAYKYGLLKGLSEKENPYLQDADRCINQTLGSISSYTFGYEILVNQRRKPRLMLLTSAEFYPNAEVIYELYAYFRFFRVMLPVLQSEVDSLEKNESPKKIKKVTVKKSNKTRRKKAA
ncbi:MAG: hypothetical protein FWF82_04970 [Oscillospiraceae bacterium]|nr:hypothetical protein [Oscillospiraceae bacterium]